MRQWPLLRAYFSRPSVCARHAERATRAWNEARTTLFVCYGNICRSPFAERYAERLVSNGRTVVSAGFHPTEGLSSPEQAVTAAARWQVNLARTAPAC